MKKSKMTARQQRFVEEYVNCLNARKAAERAGFSESSAKARAYEWVANRDIYPHVYDEIQRRLRQTTRDLSITHENITRELARIGFADIRDVVTWEDGRLRLQPSHRVTDDAAAAIAEISERRGGLRVKLHDKRAALVDLGKIAGLFKDGVDVTVPVTFTVVRTTPVAAPPG